MIGSGSQSTGHLHYLGRSAGQVNLEGIDQDGEDYCAYSQPQHRTGDAEAGGQQGREGGGYPDRYDFGWLEDGLFLLVGHRVILSRL
jgi:hypothetical protein